MRTLGIDLSTAETQTAACVLHWDGVEGRDLGGPPRLGLADGALLAAMSEADRVGIDAPFGWPDPFRVAIDAWSERGEWLAGPERGPLRLRRTDVLAVQPGSRPMSVSADRLGATAMRCAHLLAEHHLARGEALDRVGGHVLEVYPAGAFAAWGYVEARRYKEGGAGDLRRRLAERLQDDADLELGEATVAACAASDHALDALVCALVTRAAALGLTQPVPAGEDPARIAREGWIHLPLADSLGRLAQG
jgi:hypothetical protein